VINIGLFGSFAKGMQRAVRDYVKKAICREENMKGELTAIIEKAPEGGFWAICPEVPGANGQGETVEEAKKDLKEAIALILDDRIEDIKRGLPDDAIQDTIAI